MKSRLISVLLLLGVLLVPLGAAYGWVLRCACSGCRCGWGCQCPKYWTWVQAVGIFAGLALVGATIFVRVRRRVVAAS